jgi:hypothetical protein
MLHPFQDKLFVMIGKPIRCSRQVIRDKLLDVGGVPDERLTTFTDFVLALKGSSDTKAHQQALRHERCGLLTILSEDQFFDILEGKAALPSTTGTEVARMVNVISAERQEAMEIELERIKRDVIEHKRINCLAKHGVTTPDGRIKADFRNLYKARRFAEYLMEKYGTINED